jgi:hypothetical protein
MKMRNYIYTAFAMAPLVVGPAQSASAQSMAPAGSCQVALGAVVGEWREIAFNPPSKPGQAIVYGQGGHVTTGGQYNAMVFHLRAARATCDHGDAEASMHHISAVQEILGQSVHHDG